MKKIIYCFFASSIFLILIGCGDNCEVIKQKVSVDIEENKTETKITNKDIDKIKENEINSKVESHIDNEEIEWLRTEQWKKIIVSNTCTNQSTEITDENFLNEFNLDRMLGRLSSCELIGHFLYEKAQPYEYKFIKGNKEYIIEAITEDIALIEGKYYYCDNIQALGNAFTSPVEYQNVSNVLSKIYYSDLYFWGGYSFQEKHGNLVAQYIIREQENNKLKEISSLPDRDLKETATIKFYWHGEVITMMVLSQENKEYIIIKDDETTVIYEQNHVDYSILNNFGI